MALRLATIPTLLSALVCVVLERYTASNKRVWGPFLSANLSSTLAHLTAVFSTSVPPSPPLTPWQAHAVGFIDREWLKFWFLGQTGLAACDSLSDGWGRGH